MRKFKLEKQQGLYGIYESFPKTVSTEIECDEYKLNRDELLVTEDNIDKVREYIDRYYNVGDTHLGVLKSITFIKDNEETETINVFADPYYKLFEFKENDWVLVSKHSCGC